MKLQEDDVLKLFEVFSEALQEEGFFLRTPTLMMMPKILSFIKALVEKYGTRFLGQVEALSIWRPATSRILRKFDW